MKSFAVIAKILTALATIAGAVYIVATYGDKIVAWAKKLLSSCPCCDCDCDAAAEEDFVEDAAEETPAEEAPVEEVPAAEEAPVEEAAPAEEVVVEENAPIADESDFEG